MLPEDQGITEIHAKISPEEQQAIKRFLEGIVYCWCRDHKPEAENFSEKFSLHTLMGKDDNYWQGNPLDALFKFYKNKGTIGNNEGGKDAGRLLKAVLHEHPAKFGMSNTKAGESQGYFLEKPGK